MLENFLNNTYMDTFSNKRQTDIERVWKKLEKQCMERKFEYIAMMVEEDEDCCTKENIYEVSFPSEIPSHQVVTTTLQHKDNLIPEISTSNDNMLQNKITSVCSKCESKNFEISSDETLNRNISSQALASPLYTQANLNILKTNALNESFKVANKLSSNNTTTTSSQTTLSFAPITPQVMENDFVDMVEIPALHPPNFSSQIVIPQTTKANKPYPSNANPEDSLAFKTFSFKSQNKSNSSQIISNNQTSLQNYSGNVSITNQNIRENVLSPNENILSPNYKLDHYNINVDFQYVLKRYTLLKQHLFDPINASNILPIKKYRSETKRIINMIINTLSAHSSSHLCDKYYKLKAILQASDVEMIGKINKFSALQPYMGEYNVEQSHTKNTLSNHSKDDDYSIIWAQQNTCNLKEKTLRYLEDCVASAIINQGIKQVESNPKSAFILSPLANALASEFPAFHLALTANFYIALLPLFDGLLLFTPSANGPQASLTDIVALFSDERIRMLRGTFHLYLALCVTPIPQKLLTPQDAINSRYNSNSQFGYHQFQSNFQLLGENPGGFFNPGRIWSIIATCLNGLSNQALYTTNTSLQSRLRITLILADTLKTGSYVLHKQYGNRQTWKLFGNSAMLAQINFNQLSSNNLPLNNPNQSISPNYELAQNYLSMLVSRLQTQLIPTGQNNLPKTQPPEGYLSAEFWR